MNVRAFGVEDLNTVEATEINGGEITAVMVAWGAAIATAFIKGFEAGYEAATE